jgi:hypothetical protein
LDLNRHLRKTIIANTEASMYPKAIPKMTTMQNLLNVVFQQFRIRIQKDLSILTFYQTIAAL